MYKLLLCVRYLRSRYLAFVCIVSVMLGVATLIVVNSVMSGFSNKLKDRLHGTLSDIVIDTDRLSGFADHPDAMMQRILKSPAGQHVEAIAPTVEIPATFHFKYNGHPILKTVKIIGIDPKRHSSVGKFSEYLVRQKNTTEPTFALTVDALRRFEENRLFARSAPERPREPKKGDAWTIAPPMLVPDVLGPPPVIPEPTLPPAAMPRLTGIIVGYSLAHYRSPNPTTGVSEDHCVLKPGDDVFMATLGANGDEPSDMRPVYATFVVADYFKSEMSEYDSQYVYMPIDELQRLRGMDERTTHLQVKLK
ncbi:MAG: hypothetical protein ACRCZF_12440, partial [Gemmataceae bacterium]